MLRKFLITIITLNSWLFFPYAVADIVPYQGLEALVLPDQAELHVVTDKDFDYVDEQGVRRYWKTTITLERQGKAIWQRTHRELKEMKWVYGNIVPIRKGKYYADLNNDGFIEVAILPWDLGMAVYRTAEIYTVKDDGLYQFGEGRFNFELGPNVLLGCSKCWKFNLQACSSCY